MWGSEKNSELWWMLLKIGITFHPFGILYPVGVHVINNGLEVDSCNVVLIYKWWQKLLVHIMSSPLYSTSTTASLKVKGMIFAILKLSNITWKVGIHPPHKNSLLSLFPLIKRMYYSDFFLFFFHLTAQRIFF